MAGVPRKGPKNERMYVVMLVDYEINLPWVNSIFRTVEEAIDAKWRQWKEHENIRRLSLADDRNSYTDEEIEEKLKKYKIEYETQDYIIEIIEGVDPDKPIYISQDSSGKLTHRRPFATNDIATWKNTMRTTKEPRALNWDPETALFI